MLSDKGVAEVSKAEGQCPVERSRKICKKSL